MAWLIDGAGQPYFVDDPTMGYQTREQAQAVAYSTQSVAAFRGEPSPYSQVVQPVGSPAPPPPATTATTPPPPVIHIPPPPTPPTFTFGQPTRPPTGRADDTFMQGPAGGTGSGVSFGGGPDIPVITLGSSDVGLIINITDNLSIANTIGAEVGAAIHDAITEAANVASGVAQATADEVSQALGSVVNQTLQGVNSWLGSIGDWLGAVVKSVVSNLGDIVKAITNNIGDVLKTVTDKLVPVLQSITSVIDKIAAEVQHINDTLIQPIATAINTTIQTISTLTIAIEKDLHDGLSGILRIPTDIANGLSNLDATLNRTVEQLGKVNEATAKVIFTTGDGRNIPDILAAIQGSVSAGPVTGKADTTYHDFVAKLESCDVEQINELIDWAKNQYSDASGWAKFLLNVVVGIEIALLTIESGLEKTLEIGREKANRICPIAKLNPSDIVQALRRGFIDQKAAEDEALAQGVSVERLRVLSDLGKQVLGADVLMDLRFRQLIDENDWLAGMRDLGYTDTQAGALERARYSIISPATMSAAYLQGKAPKDALLEVLDLNRVSDVEAQQRVDTLFHPPGSQEALDGLSKRLLIGELNMHFDISDDDVQRAIASVYANYNASPDPGKEVLWEFARSCFSEGVDQKAAAYRWFNTYDTLQFQTWLGLYFRGIRTKTELQHVAKRFRIPSQLVDDLIDANRALLPFRTIPNMLALGAISESYARQQLQAHGYDLTQVNALLAYAQASKKSKAATAASTLHDVSVSVARSFFDDGAISEAQYRDILKDHGMSPSAIDLTVKVETLEASQKARKQMGTDIVNEALIGLITYDQAATQLANNNFTPAEQAKYLRQIQRLQRQTSKTPSEAELTKFLKKGVIDEPTYRDALATLGYAAKWIDAFVILNAGEATP